MSGGVDSSVAAARLVDQGWEVVGVTLHLWDQLPGTARGRCCAPEDVHDARRVADRLGIPHYSFDRRDTFLREVVEPFVEEYLRGHTPSPCTKCNQQIKLPALLRIADMIGARKVATGHYARVLRDARGHVRVARGLDLGKDQSYYLYALAPDVLERLELVLGTSTKADVRQEALRRGLAGASKGESQDLCFVPGASYHEVIERFAGDRIRPGIIVDRTGQRLADHRGIHRFTVGQRKGLGLGPGPTRFVTRIDGDEARVVVGPEADLFSSKIRVAAPRLASGVVLPMRASVRVRYRHDGQDAWLRDEGGTLCICFDEPVRAPTVGQAAVGYDGDFVVAGGVVTEVIPQAVA
ncbi:MAG: tRNA 2-thiouridine(34) synthase MnmA [Deltaproteobacteria bacterium]|nr:tRNA 2-thiouridine(34) synthase MnmA [Deltaproteobacteria bacterium]